MHRMGKILLKNSICENDLGLLLYHKLNMSQQWNAAAKKANDILRNTEGRVEENLESRVQIAWIIYPIYSTWSGLAWNSVLYTQLKKRHW